MKQKLSLILAIMLIAVTIGCVFPGVAFAAEGYVPERNSDVMDDLHNWDKDFAYTDYGDNFIGRYSVEFITLLEGSEGEVFVYLALNEENVATSISISTAPYGTNKNFVNYTLTCLSSYDFYDDEDCTNWDCYWHIDKYLVNGLTVSGLQRVYDVEAVYREWNPSFDIDDPDRTFNNVPEAGYSVELRFVFGSSSDSSGGLSDLVDVTKYSDVWVDLNQDTSFAEQAETLVPDEKYGMNVFQVAESANGELFVYVSWWSYYDITVTSIRLATSIGEYARWSDYQLQLLSTHMDGNLTFGKFLVVGFTLQPGIQRYYDIAGIFRQWDSDIDGPKTNNTVNEVPYQVSKLFIATTVNDTVTYSVQITDVIVFNSMYVSNIRFEHGLVIDFEGMRDEATTGHYVAFSTDHKIDELLEADVSFIERDWSFDGPFWEYFKDSRKLDLDYQPWSDPITKTLKSSDKVVASSEYFDYEYTWGTIQSVDNFLASLDSYYDGDSDHKIELSERDLANLKGKQWVLMFHQTELLEEIGLFSGYHYTGTDVGEVTVLRLLFRTDGVVYNLGVVSNKQTGPGSNDPGNVTGEDDILARLQAFLDRVETFFKKVGDWCAKYWWVLVIAGVVILLGVFGWIFKPLGKIILLVLKWLVLDLWYVISSPARLIVLIINKAKEHRESKTRKTKRRKR